MVDEEKTDKTKKRQTSEKMDETNQERTDSASNVVLRSPSQKKKFEGHSNCIRRSLNKENTWA
jgi:hypothetical protein